MTINTTRSEWNEMLEKMCDDYCKMPDICETQERLDRHCAECPLNNFPKKDDEYPLGRNDWQE
ncbi:MAG: hypothetical protein IKE92_11365 [Clostridiales bacterium]|nr:hypothetical protein [Clostridiales bacterium]